MANEMKHGKTLICWKIQNFDKYKKSVLWYFVAGAIGIALLVYSVWTMNFLFAVIILMFAIIILLHDLRSPDEIECSVVEGGVVLGERLYKWNEFENFWIVYTPEEEVKNLYLELKGVRPRIAIPLANQNPNKIREILSKFLVEDLEQEDEPLSEYIGRVLKI